jgi:hypothetical protein
MASSDTAAVGQEISQAQGEREVWDPSVPSVEPEAADQALDSPDTRPSAKPVEPALAKPRESDAGLDDGREVAPEADGADGTPAATPSEPPKLEWKSLEDVTTALASPESIPAAARPYVEAAMAQLQPARQALESMRAEYEASKTTFANLADQLEKAGHEGSRVLAEQMATTLEHVGRISEDHVKVAWKAFELSHPEYKAIPQDHALKASFVKMLETGEHFNLFPNEETYLDRIERAYELAAFRSKTDLQSFLPKQAAAAPAAKPGRAAASPRRGGALVSDGGIAPTPPRRGIDELTDDEVLSRHEHTLTELN